MKEFEIPANDDPVFTGEMPVAPPKPKRGGLLTLSSPGSKPPPADSLSRDLELELTSEQLVTRPPPTPVERPIARASPSRPDVDARSGRELDIDEPTDFVELDLAARPSSWPPAANSSEKTGKRSIPPSIPPVLDPRGAFGGGPLLPAAVPLEGIEADLPSFSQPQVAPPLPLSAPLSSPLARPPAVLARDHGPSLPRNTGWSTVEVMKFVALVVLPAVVGSLVVRQVSAMGFPIGGALRGDSTIASGLMAVVALVSAAAIGARAVLGSKKSRALYVATAGAVVFGIVMIIVTFAASEATELGVPQSMAGISTLVAPVAPLALALGALLDAKSAWTDAYSRGEAIRSAIFAGVMLFVALAFSPVGAVRTPAQHSSLAALASTAFG